ncbi:hypothetical protein B0H17DRAFT_1146069 [Mycena rosella]|uniref:RanBP2-type domain-containing protein n=1 Tax=Mycena rosella TaxID=1033263 RepID=A0AAD7G4V5_MYCRO|nr:hypothetical protein B0H17DRAFT_1146069 [Mycena rosella]
MPAFDNVLQRLHKLSIASSTPEHRFPLSPCSLGAPFSLSDNPSFQEVNIGSPKFAPRPPPAFDLSPQSSTSSGSDFGSASSISQDAFEAFVGTQSRVVRLFDLPPAPEVFLSSVFQQCGVVPTTMWVLRVPAADFSVWAVFHTHREACAALSLSSTRMSVATALESELEPFTKLKRFELPSNAVPPQLYINPQPTLRIARVSPLDPAPAANASSFADLHGFAGATIVPEDYTISSNPPNPPTSFRLGDWICRSQKCAAHNFGRNLTCIGCGCPRSPTSPNGSAPSNDAPQSPHHHQHFAPNPPPPSFRPQPSPRFASAPNVMQQYPGNLSPSAYGFPPQSSPSYGRAPQQQQYPSSSMQSVVNLPPPSPLGSPTANKSMSAHPLLTPSGRAFASGGKVQNISSDPLSPCIMYWPDNEPFPEQGQIRPSGLMGVPQPPILNTGNRGPISHILIQQPGDWICLKCNYLNWRRRKVCQTCLPYAEGNGDSISAAVQAERIALLTSVLAQTRLSSPASGSAHPQSHPYPPPIGRSHSTTPAQAQRPFVNFSPPPQFRAPVHRSQSHNELGSQFAQGYPIYQTSPHQSQQQQQQYQRQHLPRSPLQRHTLSADASPVGMYAPAPLLPSFLQDIVQSPTLSPSSTSSADLSFEEYEDSLPSSTRSTFSQSGGDSVNVSPLANIWRLDGEESKSLSAFPLPTRQELMGSATNSRNSSLERLRVHVSSS